MIIKQTVRVRSNSRGKSPKSPKAPRLARNTISKKK